MLITNSVFSRPVTRVALCLAYDGTAFDSYARQPRRRTVEGELLRVLADARVVQSARQARFVSGSRTDAHVSAARNVVAFDTTVHPGRILAAGTDAPPGLFLLSATPCGPDFNPRHADHRTYAYLIPPEWQFDWRRVRPAAKSFLGRHDFSNFSRPEPHRARVRRILRIRFRPSPGASRLEVTAESFGWQQVRRMVQALRGVSEGRASASDLKRAINAPNRRVDFGIAPPENLVLFDVQYTGLRLPPLPRHVRDRLSAFRWAHERAGLLYEWTLDSNGPTTRR